MPQEREARLSRQSIHRIELVAVTQGAPSSPPPPVSASRGEPESDDCQELMNDAKGG
jgi:hypothetical protein